MTRQLPKSVETNQIGRRGVTILQNLLEKEGWIFRRQDGDSDFGVDCEIEVVRKNLVTGRLVKGQIKSSSSIEFKDGQKAVQVKVSTYNLWQSMPLPTVLFHVDVKSDAVYWTPALAHQPAAHAETMTVRFDETSDLRTGLEGLRSFLENWFEVRGSESILREIGAFHRIYEDIKSDVDHYDDWSEMSDDADDRFRLFYAHALRLRLSVGMTNADIPTVDDWYMRNAGMWDSAWPLHWGTFNEAMKIIGPAYENALEIVTSRLSAAELSVENQDTWNFIKRRTAPRYPYCTMTDERSSDAKFHAQLEAKLKAVDGLKYRLRDRVAK
jgi:Domain of unknown function (DUF4365)